MSSSADAGCKRANHGKAAMQATNTLLPRDDMELSLEFLQNFSTAWKKLVNEDLKVSDFAKSRLAASRNRTFPPASAGSVPFRDWLLY
jgi:hypothetical protein